MQGRLKEEPLAQRLNEADGPARLPSSLLLLRLFSSDTCAVTRAASFPKRGQQHCLEITFARLIRCVLSFQKLQGAAVASGGNRKARCSPGVSVVFVPTSMLLLRFQFLLSLSLSQSRKHISCISKFHRLKAILDLTSFLIWVKSAKKDAAGSGLLWTLGGLQVEIKAHFLQILSQWHFKLACNNIFLYFAVILGFIINHL